MKFSLKSKLMLAFFILIFIPMVVLGYLSYTMSARAIQAGTEQQLRAYTSNAATAAEKEIESVKGLLQVASLNDVLGKAAQNTGNSDIDNAFVYIDNINNKYKDYVETIVIADVNGKALLTNETKEPNIDLSDRDYFKKVLNGSEVVSEVLVSRFTGNPAIAIAYPLKNNDKVIGVLIGFIPFDAISNNASKIKVGNNGYAYMIDKTGLLVYYHDSSKILKENLSDTTSN